MKVYVVTSGCYSDYQIEAIYSKKGDAVEHVRRLSDEGGYKEWELDKPIPDAFVSVSMKKDGAVSCIYRGVSCDTAGFSHYGSDYFAWYVKTEDKERAIKVVNEKRAQIIAAGVWGDEKATKALFNQTEKDGE